jgi:copper chaperone CopZ
VGKVSFNVEKHFCEECSLALRRFIGHMKGVEAIDVESGHIVVQYNEAEISQRELDKITRDSIEKLGYRMSDEE